MMDDIVQHVHLEHAEQHAMSHVMPSRRGVLSRLGTTPKPRMPTARKTMPKINANVRVLIPALPCLLSSCNATKAEI